MTTFISHSATETKALAQKIARNTDFPAIICLYGDLGSGKTTFSKGFGAALGLKEQNIKSPTYTLVRSYQLDTVSFHHFDFYRIVEPDELLTHEITEIFQQQKSVILIEWPERIAHLLPQKRLNIHFTYKDLHTREITYNHD